VLKIYLLIGLIFASMSRDNQDRRILTTNPVAGVAIAVLWPLVLLMLFFRLQSIKFRGKILWERKP
jgi:hypothetical protein